MQPLTRRQLGLGCAGILVETLLATSEGKAAPPRGGARDPIRAELARAAATLPAEREAARRAGLPLTPADVDPYLRIRPDEDAAPLYDEYERRQKALELAEHRELPHFEINDSQTVVSRAVLGDLNAERLAALTAAIERRRPLLDLAWRIPSRPRCRPRTDYRRLTDTKLEPYGAMRDATRMLTAHALLEASASRPEQAVRAMIATGQIERHADEGMLLISRLVQAAVGRLRHAG